MKRWRVPNIGDIFGRLTIIGTAEPNARSQRRVVVQCSCGSAPKTVALYPLQCGDTKSCGCLRQEMGVSHATTHGKVRTKVYRCWCSVLARITNPNVECYKRYGGRGIDIDPRWLTSFEAFYADMGDPPTLQHTIERNDNERGYWPDNCRWATLKEQAQNKRNTAWVVLDGERLAFAEAARRLGRSIQALQSRKYRHKATHQEVVDHFRGVTP